MTRIRTLLSLNTLTVGQPLVGVAWMTMQLEISESQYPHSRAASCRKTHRSVEMKRQQSLNTLTVGQPLVGSYIGKDITVQSGLNTLTVGQPLVGGAACPTRGPGQQVSIPSQSGSLLSECPTAGQDSSDLVSIPSQSGSLLSVATGKSDIVYDKVSIPSQSGSLLSAGAWHISGRTFWRLNTLTVGQPLVGSPASVLALIVLFVSIPSQSGSLLSAVAISLKVGTGFLSQYPHSRAASCRGQP